MTSLATLLASGKPLVADGATGTNLFEMGLVAGEAPEIWNIEQNTSFPQKRIAVCSNEGGKDYIGLYYRQTFQNSKPRFLSLQESN